MERGFGEVTNDVLSPDNEDSTILLCFAKKPSSEAKPSINVPNVGVRNEIVLRDDQERFSGLVGHLKDRFYPTHPLGRTSRPPKDDVAVSGERLFIRIDYPGDGHFFKFQRVEDMRGGAARSGCAVHQS